MKQLECWNQKMAQSSIPRSFVSLCFPSVIAALLPTLFGMWEAFLSAQIGGTACQVIGITFPLHAAIQTIGFVFGTGAGSLIASALGMQDYKKANQLAFGAFLGSLICAEVLCFAGLSFLSPLLSLLGTKAEFVADVKTYLFCLLPSAPVMCACFVLANLLRAEGKALQAMVGFACGNLVSVLSSWLFVYGKIGILALGFSLPIGYLCALLFLLFPYWKNKCTVSLKPVFSQNMLVLSGQAIINGLPSLFRQGLTVVAVLLLNRVAGNFGDDVIFSVSVAGRLFLLLYAIPLGIGQGIIPAVGYHLGRQNEHRAKQFYGIGVIVASALLLLASIPTAIFARNILLLFGQNGSFLQSGIFLLRGLCFVLPLHGVIALTNLLLQVLKKPIAASVLAASRQGIFFLPLILTLPKSFGLSGIWITQPLADGLTFLLALFFLIRFLKYKKRLV